jgi:small subunit ribosomal protein S9
MAKNIKAKSVIISGKRKTSVAKLRILEGKGEVFYNGLPHKELSLFHRLALEEPLRIFEKEMGALNNTFRIKTKGGGKESQIQAARLAISKALVSITGSDTLKKAFIKYDRNMIVTDSRRKEARKPGDSKARAMRQSSKR